MTTGQVWYPLRLTAAIRTDPFGGRRIAERFGRRGLPDSGPVSETVEIGSDDPGAGRVRNGRLAGERLNDLVVADRDALVGPDADGTRFPLAVRLVDAANAPPMRVYQPAPDASSTSRRACAVVAAVHILDCPDGSLFGIGDGEGFHDVPVHSDGEVGLRWSAVQPGETIPLPAGVSYAYGPGTLAYEVNRTFVDRRDAGAASDGDAMATLADQTIAEPDCDLAPLHGLTRFDGAVRIVVGCGAPDLALERWNLAVPYRVAARGHCLVLTNLGAAVGIAWTGGLDTLPRATTCIIPAAIGPFTLVPNGKAVLLASFVPNPERDIIGPLRASG